MLEGVGAVAWYFPYVEGGSQRGGGCDSPGENVAGGGEVFPSGSLQEVLQGFRGMRGAGGDCEEGGGSGGDLMGEDTATSSIH